LSSKFFWAGPWVWFRGILDAVTNLLSSGLMLGYLKEQDGVLFTIAASLNHEISVLFA
jgi:hypothetical protein